MVIPFSNEFKFKVCHFLGRKNAIKCKAEAKAPKLTDFIDVLSSYERSLPKYILVVTDDIHILEEISQVQEKRYVFLQPEPAPLRIPDKVSYSYIYSFICFFDYF